MKPIFDNMDEAVAEVARDGSALAHKIYAHIGGTPTALDELTLLYATLILAGACARSLRLEAEKTLGLMQAVIEIYNTIELPPTKAPVRH